MSDFLGIHGTALALREQRLQVLAANIANADTPGYRAQDVDFNAALRLATSPLQSPGADPIAAAIDAARHDAPSSQPSLDGNTVDPDAERAAYGRAALEYRASLNFLESKVRTLLTSITGQ